MRITISVSDPWDFGEAIEWKLLAGQMLQVADDDQGGRGLIMLDDAVNYDGSAWRYFVAKVRHQGDKITSLHSGKKVLSSMIGISAERAKSAQPLDTDHWRGGLAFIGDLVPVK
jgi:hypothetical protein